MAETLAEAQTNLSAARTRLRSKQREVNRLRKASIFKGVTIKDQFRVGRGGIKTFRKQKKIARRSTLRQLGVSKSDLPMLRDELNLRKAELDFFSISDGDVL